MSKKLSTGKLDHYELMSIGSGINFVVLESSMNRNLAEGERTLSVRFSRPVLKRPLTPKMCDFILEWAKVHPRHWVVEVTGHYRDGELHYDETVELEAVAKLDWLTEAYKAAIDEVSSAGNPRHLLGVSWRARIKSEAERKKQK
jgi:hypothetical protein